MMREQEIQRAVFKHLDQRGAPNVFAFHPANGGYRRRVEAAILKGTGVKSGVPDVIAIKSGQTFGLELKAERGRISESQVKVLQALQSAGATVAVAYSLDEALAFLEKWGLLRGKAA